MGETEKDTEAEEAIDDVLDLLATVVQGLLDESSR